MDKVTVAEAAEQLGISQDAVRRRIRQGTIDYERTEQGWLYVYLTPKDTKPNRAQEELLKHIQRENDFLRQQLERKDHLLAAALERIPLALGTSPKAQEPPASPSKASSSSEVGQQPAEEAHEKRDKHQRLAESLERVDSASSQKVKEDSQAEEQLPDTNRSDSSRSAAKAPWVRIGIATFLAGAIPPIIMNVVVLVAASYTVGPAINHPPLSYAYLFVYFLVHLLPLPLGIQAGRVWPGSHPRGNVLLGIAAGSTEALIGLGIVGLAPDMVYLAIEDIVGWFSTSILFVSGALYGDLLESRRKMIAAPQIARSSDQAALNERTRLLLQAVVPSVLGLVGTIVTALAALLPALLNA